MPETIDQVFDRDFHKADWLANREAEKQLDAVYDDLYPTLSDEDWDYLTNWAFTQDVPWKV